MIKQLSSKGNIKTYKAKIEPIIKEISPRNRNEYDNILYNLQNYKNLIYEIIEENNKIYVVLLNDNINLDNINVIKEGYKYYDSPITRLELNELFLKEKAICKIITSRIENNLKVYGTGFFVKLDDNQCGLFTNNHIINNIQVGDTIHFNYLSKYKKLEITKDRKVYTNEELDYTFIEIFKEDNIQDFFKISPYNINNLIHYNIFILQYQNNNTELSFSYGEINSININNIRYNASTTYGSSGSPIILRANVNLVIGLHHSTECSLDNKFKFNLGTTFNSILTDIQQKNRLTFNKNINYFKNIYNNNFLSQSCMDIGNKIFHEFKNEINCIYKKNYSEPIYLLHDFKLLQKNDEKRKLYQEAKRNINEDNIDIYINNKKIKFNYKYESNEMGLIKVKYKFNKLLTSTSYMFCSCFSLQSIDLSSFNTDNVTNMSDMFFGCSSLKSIHLSSLNTNNVTNMSNMFFGCSSLESINLSSLNTNKVTNMSFMFYNCSSLKSVNLSSLNTSNVANMSYMFSGCNSLKSINLSSFNTNNVTNMSYIFSGCSGLTSIDLSSFNTNSVTNMEFMFSGCSSIRSIDLSSFNTNNVNNMNSMFYNCSSCESINLSSFKSNNVTDVSFMFDGCTNLKSIDLSSFNVYNVRDMGCMFYKCFSLKRENVKLNKNEKIILSRLPWD